MKAQSIARLASRARLIASATSIVAFVAVAGGLATHGQLGFQIGQYFRGRPTSPGLAVYLAMLLAVGIGYLTAVRGTSARGGSLLAIASVAGMYAWCQYYANITLQPIFLAIAGPAMAFLVSEKLKLASLTAQHEAPSTDQAPQNAPVASETPAEVQPQGELVAGAA